MGKFCEGNLISLSRFPLSESCLDSCHCFLLRKRVTQKNKSSLPHPARPKGDGSVATCRDATVPFWGEPVWTPSTGPLCGRSQQGENGGCSLMTVVYDIFTHRIHVWHIYLHLVDFYGKWVNIPYMDGMGYRFKQLFWRTGCLFYQHYAGFPAS